MKTLSFFLSIIFIFSLTQNLKAGAKNTSLEPLDPDLLNPLYRYTTKDQWREITDEVLGQDHKRYKMDTLFINTQDKNSCEAIKKSIIKNKNWKTKQDIAELCKSYKDYPWSSITVVRPVGESDTNNSGKSHNVNYNDNSNNFELRLPLELRPRDSGLTQETFNFGIMGLGVVGVLLALPESVTKWDKSKDQDDLLNQWKDNVRNGPIVDEDDWAVNYIGHPYVGAAYYVVARHMNYSRLDSFKYSFLMSTFFWEYGVEAFAEIPSIQDLIVRARA